LKKIIHPGGKAPMKVSIMINIPGESSKPQQPSHIYKLYSDSNDANFDYYKGTIGLYLISDSIIGLDDYAEFDI
jgi:hypothetical protein